MKKPGYEGGSNHARIPRKRPAIRQIPADAKLVIKSGEEPVLSVATAFSEPVTCRAREAARPARERPVTEEDCRKQLNKTGGTPFYFQNTNVDIDESVFFPLGALNALRREAVSELTSRYLASFRRKAALREGFKEPAFYGIDEGRKRSCLIAAEAASVEQLSVLCNEPGIRRIYLDHLLLTEEGEEKNRIRQVKESGKEAFAALPYILREEDEKDYIPWIKRLNSDGIDGFLVRNPEEAALHLSGEASFGERPWIADAGLYTWNRRSRGFIRELGASADTAPYELNRKELKQRGLCGGEIVVYGRIPMMQSAQCLKKTASGCDRRPSWIGLTDRMKVEFKGRNRCDFCYNTLYNSVPLDLISHIGEILKENPLCLRLSFTTEDRIQTAAVLKECIDALDGKVKTAPMPETTRGHFLRGVE